MNIKPVEVAIKRQISNPNAISLSPINSDEGEIIYENNYEQRNIIPNEKDVEEVDSKYFPVMKKEAKREKMSNKKMNIELSKKSTKKSDFSELNLF